MLNRLPAVESLHNIHQKLHIFLVSENKQDLAERGLMDSAPVKRGIVVMLFDIFLTCCAMSKL